MGQRHQAFFIARVRPTTGAPAYLCLGGFYHQWCYGQLALHAMYRFITLVRQPENAAVVRAELRALDGKYPSTEKDAYDVMPSMPCPFSSTLLGLAYSANLDPRLQPLHYSGVDMSSQYMLRPSSDCWRHQNDDGLAVIDITIPERPAYCFLHTGEDESWLYYRTDALPPLNAYEYLRVYYKLHRLKRDQKEAARNYFVAVIRLTGIPLISAENLQQAWPSNEFEDHDSGPHEVIVGENFSYSVADRLNAFSLWKSAIEELLPKGREILDTENATRLMTLMVHAETPPGTAATVLPRIARRLEALLRKLLRESHIFNFQCVPNSDVPRPYSLEQLEAMVSTCISNQGSCASIVSALLAEAKTVKDVLRRLNPFPDSHAAIILLRNVLTALKEAIVVDLSGFNLSATQICSAIARTAERIEFLDISFNTQVTTADITTILLSSPSLLRLNIIGCDRISRAELFQLLRKEPAWFRTIEGIFHPAFLSHTKYIGCPIAFTFIRAGAHDGVPTGLCLPFFTPAQILQGIYAMLPMAWDSSDRLGVTSTGGTHEGHGKTSVQHLSLAGKFYGSVLNLAYAAFTGGTLRTGELWSQRSVVCAPIRPYPFITISRTGSWAFFLSWGDSATSDSRTIPQWGFIRYRARHRPVDSESTYTTQPRDRQSDVRDVPWCRTFDADVTVCYPSTDDLQDAELLDSEVYDLRGFLRCMAEEGRPMPSQELVANVERVLYARDYLEGTLLCPLMAFNEAPKFGRKGGAEEEGKWAYVVAGDGVKVYRLPEERTRSV
ncbi:hypothetical protein C8Q79DRAFT_1011306 [Trametes meyenii]|nr:hypothetical protein C8Q79DRAFT_1011306 [Trametes meyenii]